MVSEKLFAIHDLGSDRKSEKKSGKSENKNVQPVHDTKNHQASLQSRNK